MECRLQSKSKRNRKRYACLYEEAEETALLTTIANETDAFYKRDYERGISTTATRRPNGLPTAREQRIMQKEAGRWKIANVSAFRDYKNRLPAESLS